MEFKYRAIDNAPTPIPPPKQTSYPPRPAPVSTITFFSDHSLRGGYPGMVTAPAPTGFRIPASNADAGAIASEALRREMEKARIRREIIAGEVARRMQLEEEVRRELAMERGWVVPMQRNLGMTAAAAAAGGFSFEERLAMRLDAGVMSPFDVPKPPQIMEPLEIEPPSVVGQKVIMLAKPNPDLYAAKRKAVSPPVVDSSEHPPVQPLVGLKKKPKAEWSCALCQVSATCESGLNDHLKGKKHRAKEAALKPRKIKKVVKSTEAVVTAETPGLDAKADSQPLQPQPGVTGTDLALTMVDKAVVASKNEAQLVQGTATPTTGHEAAAGRMNAPKFWCELCQMGPLLQVMFTNHVKGKKHGQRMKRFFLENGRPWTASHDEAPLSIKETDSAVDETDDGKEEKVVDNASAETSADDSDIPAVAKESA